ncbi:MAG: hypothetical protein H7Y17_13060 [Chlorobia bacterium]|nr:hypothetical protein [Fimbriimonadaceae bacterium]
MRYYVVGSKNEMFGPADIPTLNQWISEGRLVPTSMMQEESGGARFAASMLPGLIFGAAYPRGSGTAIHSDNGSTDMKNAWTYGIVGIFCFGVILGPLGLAAAIKAKKKGHPQAVGGIVLCSFVTVLALLGLYVMTSGGGLFSRLFR